MTTVSTLPTSLVAPLPTSLVVSLPPLSSQAVKSAAASGALTIQFVAQLAMVAVLLVLAVWLPSPTVREVWATWVLCAWFAWFHMRVFAWSDPSRGLLHCLPKCTHRAVCVLLLVIYACAPWGAWFVGHRLFDVEVVPPLPVWSAPFQLTQLLLVCYHLGKMRYVHPDAFDRSYMGDRLLYGLRVWGWLSLMNSGIVLVVMRCIGVPGWSSANPYRLCSDAVGGDFLLELLLHVIACAFACWFATDEDVVLWITWFFHMSDLGLTGLVERFGRRVEGICSTVRNVWKLCIVLVIVFMSRAYSGQYLPTGTFALLIAVIAVVWYVSNAMRRGTWPCFDPHAARERRTSTRMLLSLYAEAHRHLDVQSKSLVCFLEAVDLRRLVDRLDGYSVAQGSASQFLENGSVNASGLATITDACASTAFPRSRVPLGMFRSQLACYVAYVLGGVCRVWIWPLCVVAAHSYVCWCATNIGWFSAMRAYTQSSVELFVYYLVMLMATTVVWTDSGSAYVRVLHVFNETGGRPDYRHLNSVFENCTLETYAAWFGARPWIPFVAVVLGVQCLLVFCGWSLLRRGRRNPFGWTLSLAVLCVLVIMVAGVVSYPFSNDLSLGTLVHYGVAHVYASVVAGSHVRSLEMQLQSNNETLVLIAETLLAVNNQQQLAAFSARSALDVLISAGCGSPTRPEFGPGLAHLALNVGYTKEAVAHVYVYCGRPEWHHVRNLFNETRGEHLERSLLTFARVTNASEAAPVRVGIDSCAAGVFNATCNASNFTAMETFAPFRGTHAPVGAVALVPVDEATFTVAFKQTLVSLDALVTPGLLGSALAFMGRTNTLSRAVGGRGGFTERDRASQQDNARVLATTVVDTTALADATMKLMGVTKDVGSDMDLVPHARGLAAEKPWTWNRLLPPCARKSGLTISSFLACEVDVFVNRYFGE